MEINKWFAAIDTHSGGEPLRIITGGLPPLKGSTMQEKADYFHHRFDSVRKVLMAEPRGHYGMIGAIVTAAAREDRHIGLLFMDNSGLTPISGHGIIAAVTAWLETGQLQEEDAVQGIRIDTQAGEITAYASLEGSVAKSVTFEGVPSYVVMTDMPVQVDSASFTVDLVYSGALYVIVKAESLSGVTLTEDRLPDLQQWAGRIMSEVSTQQAFIKLELHTADIHGVFIYEEALQESTIICRNVTVYAGQQFDRSPGGMGACAHLAVKQMREELQMGEEIIYQGIAGSQIIGKTNASLVWDGRKAIIPQLTGDAFITGHMNFVIDPSDPLSDGFVLR